MDLSRTLNVFLSLGVLFILFILIGTGVFWIIELRKTERLIVSCKANLRCIGLAIYNYQMPEKQEVYPSSLHDVVDLYISKDCLDCPASEGDINDYTYLRPRKRDFYTLPSCLIIVFDSEPWHRGGRIVAALDCAVEYMKEKRFKKAHSECLKYFRYFYAPEVTRYDQKSLDDWKKLREIRTMLTEYFENNNKYPGQLSELNKLHDNKKWISADEYVYLRPHKDIPLSPDIILAYNKEKIDGKGRHILYSEKNYERDGYSPEPVYVIYYLEEEFQRIINTTPTSGW